MIGKRLASVGTIFLILWVMGWQGVIDAAPSSPFGKASPHDQTTPSATLSEIFRLIDTYYVEPVSISKLLTGGWKRLILTLPPHCIEGISPIWLEETNSVWQSVERSHAVATACNMERSRIVSMLINFALRDLDPNTSLLDPIMVKELRISLAGEFGGVGMTVSSKDGRHTVLSVTEGSPAHRAGIRLGDEILEIDGLPLADMSLREVLERVRGPLGSVIWLTVREATTDTVRHLRLRRTSLIVPPVRSAVLSGDIGYLRLLNFQKNTTQAVQKTLRKLKKQTKGTMKGLILDLRDNPGGLFHQAVQVADMFVDSGIITSIRGRGGQLHQEFKASHRVMKLRVPLVTLINHRTASAAEVLVGALKGRPDVVVMGERSFGKGSVQAVYPLPTGEALRLTTAHYYTASGCDIEGKGLEPDIQISAANSPSLPEEGELYPASILSDPVVLEACELLQVKALGGRESRVTLH